MDGEGDEGGVEFGGVVAAEEDGAGVGVCVRGGRGLVFGVCGPEGGVRVGKQGLGNRGWEKGGDDGGGGVWLGRRGLTEIIQPEAVGSGVD